jgi:copper chaperone CopZ
VGGYGARVIRTLTIDGMHCGACVEKLTAALSRVPGVDSARVTLSTPAARVESRDKMPLSAF